MIRTPSFASTRRRLAGSAAHSVFSQSNLRSAAPSSVASSTSAPPAPSEADLFDPVRYGEGHAGPADVERLGALTERALDALRRTATAGAGAR